MAILMQQEVHGITADQAEAVMAPLFAQLMSYPGFIAHASGPISGGYQVTEVWESQEAHERWVREFVVPSIQQSGMNLPLPPAQYLTLAYFTTR